MQAQLLTYLNRKGKAKKETPNPPTPPPPPPTPPYKQITRPGDKTKVNKSGKRNQRRQAEAEVYPWHRDIKFQMAKELASWDDSGYDPEVLEAMARTRDINRPYIQKADDDLNEKQRKLNAGCSWERRVTDM